MKVFPGFYGVLLGVSMFLSLWLLCYLCLPKGPFDFDARGENGRFEKILGNYFDITKLIIGLASGSVVLLISTSALRSDDRVVTHLVTSLYLLVSSIVYGLVFMIFATLEYERYQHDPKRVSYTRGKYATTQALGFSGLLCFCAGYIALIAAVTTGVKLK